MKNKFFARIIITTLLVTFLTFNVGRVTRVSAVGTTIAGAAAASLCAVGIVYCSYMLLSGAAVHVPDSLENIEDWLTDMGTKVVQYPSGRAAYEEIYPEMIGVGDEPLHSILDRAWTWTTDKLKSWANDFSSVSVNQSIASFTQVPNYMNHPTNSYDYGTNFTTLPNTVYFNYNTYTFDELLSYGYNIQPLTGPYIYITIGGNYPTTLPSNLPSDISYRNYFDGEMYYAQHLIDGRWVNFNPTCSTGYDISTGDNHNTTRVNYPSTGYTIGDSTFYNPTWYPLFPNEGIYDATTDTWTPAVPLSGDIVNPQYPVLPPEDDNKPVIPYLKLPFDPNWIDPVTNLPGGGNWGFNLAQLLDKLEDLANLLMEVGALGEIINQFKTLLNGQAGDEYYIYYDDSNNNYYTYYTITNFGDNIYNYDIDVSETDEHLPVDLNTIQVYTNNNYVNTVKGRARLFGEAIGEYVAFWHNSDPESLYTILGSFVVILIGAFIGKWGHS